MLNDDHHGQLLHIFIHFTPGHSFRTEKSPENKYMLTAALVLGRTMANCLSVFCMPSVLEHLLR